MGKTFRDTLVKPRSLSSHNSGWAREKDRHSHHSHRNANVGSDEASFVQFDRGSKAKYQYTRVYDSKSQKSNVYNDSRNLTTFFDEHGWEGKTLEENITNQIKSPLLNTADQVYLKSSLKQLKRRGAAKKFTGHDKYSDKLDFD